MSDEFDALVDRLDGVVHRGRDQVDARCPVPAHDDRKASLSVARTAAGRVVLHCQAGCRWQDVRDALGMESTTVTGEPQLVAEYTYTDEAGVPLYVVERWQPKTFRQRLVNGSRRAPQPEQRVLYNLPAVMAVHEQPVKSLFYVEGEKDCNTLANLGYAATTTLGGANKPWQPQYTDALSGLHVVVVADNDEPGRKWARTVANHLQGVCTTAVVTPPKGIKDVSELVEAGFHVKDLLPVADTMGEVSTAADYPVQQVQWLWPGRIPAHMLTLLEGDPGTGKSTMTMELIACLTTGRRLPGVDRWQEPLRVGVLSDEDNWSMVVVPRLKAAGADLYRVMHFKGIRDGDGFLSPYSLHDLATLRHDVRKVGVDVLVIDPLMAYMGIEVDTHRDQQVRSVLGPLVQMAEEDGVTVLAIRHFTKGSAGGKAIYRGGGSIGFTGQARAVLQTAEHPSPDETGHYVLAVAKCNLAPLSPSLGYQIDIDERLQVGRIVWDELAVPYTAQQLQGLAAGGAEEPKLSPAKRSAREWLEAWLEANYQGEPLRWADVLKAAVAEGMGKSTLESAEVRSALLLPLMAPGEGTRGTRWIPISQSRTEHSGSAGNAGNAGSGPSNVGSAPADDLARRLDPGGYDDGDDDRTSCDCDPTSCISCTSCTSQVFGGGAGSAELVGEVVLAEPVVCSICGSTDGVVIDDDDPRCRVHNPLVWTKP